MKILKILVFVFIISFYCFLLLNRIELVVADDLARHIKNGELILRGEFGVLHSNYYSFTHTDFPFSNHHWLSGIIFYLLYQAFSWTGLVIFKIFVLLLSFAILFKASLKKAGFWPVTIFSVPTIIILAERTAVRPEIFSVLFTVIFLYLLLDPEEHVQSKKIFWLVPLQLLWVNMHLFFVIGPILVAGFLLEKIILNCKKILSNILIKKLSILLILLIAASFANLNGVEGILYPFRIFNNYGMDIIENRAALSFLTWRPPQENLIITVFLWAAISLAVSFVIRFIYEFFTHKKSKPIFFVLASIVTAIGGFKMVRLLPFFGLIFLPAISANLDGSLDRLSKFLSKKLAFSKLKPILAVSLILLLSYFIFLKINNRFISYKKFGVSLAKSSNDSAAFFKKHNLKGPIFNNFDVGSYIIYHLYPREKVFVDNRSEAYPASFLKDIYLETIEDENKWEESLKQYRFNSLFLYYYESNLRPFIIRRLKDPNWSLVYADSYAIIFVKNSPENSELIKEFGITSDNVEQRLKTLSLSGNYDDQVAAADLFNLLGRLDLGKRTFRQIVNKWPGKGKIWMLLGQMSILNKNNELAIEYLEKAINLGWKTPESYGLLGLAHINLGEFEEAASVLKKALKINPNDQDAIRLLKRTQF